MDTNTKARKMTTLEMMNFSKQVAAQVWDEYGVGDGADLCFNLMEAGVIHDGTPMKLAARIVARHLQHA